MIASHSKLIVAAILASVSAGVLCGCGNSSDAPKVDPVFRAHVDSMRGYFDKTHGDYTALSGVEKAEYIKAAGGNPQVAAKLWDKMKYGPGGAPKGATPTAP